jgi:hypothetical protein
MFSNFTSTQRNLLVAIAAVILFVASTSVSYSVFAAKFGAAPLIGNSAPNIPTASGGLITETGPLTQECPINGSMHNQQAKDAWSKRRPLAVMVENSTDARPQSGISYADAVYEAVAEGGITRFMAVFYCNSLQDVQVGPVRSARTYFLDWLSEYDGLYAHVGGANTAGPADALGQIITYKIKDLNQFNIGFPTYWRDYERLKKADGSPVATEHTMYSTTQKLWDIGAKRGWTNVDETGTDWTKNFVPWKFKDDQAGAGTTGSVEVHFWESVGYASDYNVVWSYDKACNCYKRANGGQSHMDKDNNQQLQPKNVVVQMETESHANDGYTNNEHLLYADNGTKGAASGIAYIFQDGKVIKGKWTKATRLTREKFLDESGKEVAFNRGQIWIETVPIGSTVKF